MRLKILKKNKIKIVFNDYLNIGKSFIDDKEIKIINAIIDKIINEKNKKIISENEIIYKYLKRLNFNKRRNFWF